jgi:hypothetical protein
MATTVSQLTQDQIKQSKDARRSEARKAFRKFWIGGVAGTFFAAIARSLPVDWKTRSVHPELEYTVDVLLRYGYMFWFTVYFFMTTFNTDQEKAAAAETEIKAHDWRDIGFDVLQSLCATVAVTLLAVGADGSVRQDLTDYRAASIAITLIGLVSLVLFSDDTSKNIQWMRGWTALLAGISLVLTLVLAKSLLLSLLLFGLLIGLWIVLGFYSRLRVDVSSSRAARASAKPAKGGAPAAPAEEAKPAMPPVTNNDRAQSVVAQGAVKEAEAAVALKTVETPPAPAAPPVPKP